MKLVFNIYPKEGFFGENLQEQELIKEKKYIEEQLKRLKKLKRRK